MPVLRDLVGSVSPAGVLPVHKTLLEKITAPLMVFDYPGNIARGAAFALTERGGYSDFIRAIKGERIGGEELLDTDSFLKGLAIEVALDPLLFVGGLGRLTQAGAITKRIATLNSAAKVLKGAGKLDDLAKVTASIQKLEQTLAKLPKQAHRSIASIGLPFGPEKTIGDFSKVTNLIGNLNPLPDVRSIELTRELNKLTKQMVQIKRKGYQPKKTLEKYVSLQGEIEGLHKGLVDPETADRIRGLFTKPRALFRRTARNPEVEALIDFTKINERKGMRKVGEMKLAALADFERIRKTTQLTEANQAKRLMQGIEARFIREEIPDVQAWMSKEVTKVYDKQLKELQRIGTSKRIKPENHMKLLQKAQVAFTNKLAKIRDKAYRKSHRLDDAEKLMGDLVPSELEWIDTYVSGIENLAINEARLGIDIERLNTAEVLLSYIRRALTPEALALKKSKPHKYNLMMTDASARLGASKMRALMPEADIPTINKLLREDYGIKYDFFNENPIESLVTRHMEHVNSVSRAEAVHLGVKLWGIEKPLRKGTYVTAKDFFKQMGLRPEVAPPNIKMPKNIVEDMTGVDALVNKSIFNNQGALVSFFATLDTVVNTPFRVALTTFFPAFHNRNMVGNIFLNHLAGMKIQDIPFYDTARVLQKAIRKGTATTEQIATWNKLIDLGIVNKGQFREIKMFMDKFETFFRRRPDWVQKLTVKPAKTLRLGEIIDRPVSGILDVGRRLAGVDVPKRPREAFNALTGRAYGSFIEENARVAHYLWATEKKGLTSFEAMRSVNKYLFDYSKLSNFEKQFMRPSFLFYTWMRNNIPLMIKTAITEPRLASFYSKLIGIGKDEIPTYLRASVAFKNPFAEDSAIGSLGLPIEDLNLINVGDVDPSFFDQMSRISDKIISRMSPLLRLPYEMMIGRTTFRRRPLKDLNVKQLLTEISPISRFVRTGEKIFDPEEDLKFRMLDALTGVRTYKIDPVRVSIDQHKRTLLSGGKFMRSGFLVFPKKQFKEDPAVQEQYRTLLRMIRDRKH